MKIKSELAIQTGIGIVTGLLTAVIPDALKYLIGKDILSFLRANTITILAIFSAILAFLVAKIICRREVGQAADFNKIRVYKVLRADISWPVVWDGAERLYQQILRLRGMFPAEETMFMGVNALGTAIGVAIAYRYGRNIPIPIGMVQTKGGECNRAIDCIKYPYSTDPDRLHLIKHVLIIDGLMKTGNSAKIIKDRIATDFAENGNNPDVKVAVLILCRLDLS